MIRYAVAMIFVLALIPTAYARASEMDTALNACSMSRTRSHAEMRECLKKAASASNAALAAAEEKLLKNISEREEDANFIQDMKTAFQSSRRAYKNYRDKQCDFYASLAAGGNAAGDLRFACDIVLNKMQIEQLDWASSNWK